MTRIDRRIPTLGRVQISTGARTAAQDRARRALFERLVAEDRIDLIRALRDGQLAWEHLVEDARSGQLATTLQRAKLNRPLAALVAEHLGVPDATHRGYRVSFTALLRSGALPAQPTGLDLLHVDWRALERRWGRSPAQWHHRSIHAAIAGNVGPVPHPLPHPAGAARYAERGARILTGIGKPIPCGGTTARSRAVHPTDEDN